MNNIELEMFLAFREHINRICHSNMVKMSKAGNEYRVITHEGKTVGFLMLINGYVEGIYVMPEYRRRGLARKAVIDYIGEGGVIELLHIANGNEVAQAFWESLFLLKRINENPVDALYEVVGIREASK